jgi:hypothetical protein
MRRVLLLLLVCVSAYADGGRVVLREQAGSLVVTVFAAPADVSVMVQDRTSQRPVLDAEVQIRIGDSEQLRATHEQAQNKLLYAAAIGAGQSGKQALVVEVRRGAERAEVGGTIEIAPPAPMLAANWEFLALPGVLIALFAVRERLVRRRAGAAILVR